MNTVYVQSTGEIIGRFRVTDGVRVSLGEDETPTGVVAGESDPNTQYVIETENGPEIRARPTLPVPVLQSSQTMAWLAIDCPAGMEIEVWDTDLGELLGTATQETPGVIGIELSDPGDYRFVSKAPFPFLSATLDVVIP